MIDSIVKTLGGDADNLLQHVSKGIAKEHITIPAPDHVGSSFGGSDRNGQVLANLERLHRTAAGRHGLPVIRPSTGIGTPGGLTAPISLSSRYIGSPSRAATVAHARRPRVGVAAAQDSVHRQINHEALTYPKRGNPIRERRAGVEDGAAAVGATIICSEDSTRNNRDSDPRMPTTGLASCCVLPAQSDFKWRRLQHRGGHYQAGQPPRRRIQANIIAEAAHQQRRLQRACSARQKRLYDGTLMTDHPIGLVRWQVTGTTGQDRPDQFRRRVEAPTFTGRAHRGVNKRGGGISLISGRSAGGR